MSRIWIIPVDGRYVEWDVADVRMEWLQEMLGGFVETVKLPDDPGVLWAADEERQTRMLLNPVATYLVQHGGLVGWIAGSTILTGMESSAGFTDAPDLPALLEREARLRDEAWARYHSDARVSEAR